MFSSLLQCYFTDFRVRGAVVFAGHDGHIVGIHDGAVLKTQKQLGYSGLNAYSTDGKVCYGMLIGAPFFHDTLLSRSCPCCGAI